MASNPEEAEKWKAEAEAWRRLYGKYHRLWALVGRGEKLKAIEKYRAETFTPT
jgi:hypothetical protein